MSSRTRCLHDAFTYYLYAYPNWTVVGLYRQSSRPSFIFLASHFRTHTVFKMPFHLSLSPVSLFITQSVALSLQTQNILDRQIFSSTDFLVSPRPRTDFTDFFISGLFFVNFLLWPRMVDEAVYTGQFLNVRFAVSIISYHINYTNLMTVLLCSMNNHEYASQKLSINTT